MSGLPSNYFSIENVYYYGGLNESSPHRILYLNTLSPVGVTFWEGLGGVAFKFSKPYAVPNKLSASWMHLTI